MLPRVRKPSWGNVTSPELNVKELVPDFAACTPEANIPPSPNGQSRNRDVGLRGTLIQNLRHKESLMKKAFQDMLQGDWGKVNHVPAYYKGPGTK
ncbi:hypothetical protein Tco_0434741 [Tanacetum coccineum]